jgi:hypothetical protein
MARDTRLSGRWWKEWKQYLKFTGSRKMNSGLLLPLPSLTYTGSGIKFQKILLHLPKKNNGIAHLNSFLIFNIT